ncbi:MAG: bifunctional hydroxymethylpyrimidine kinase/phosphomethylpyrimidine kinase [Deltaproteobacteria bacterium]|nr:MAG: bifunctional hydroxymethylpyrimidine kinase/phosphomethylpyrimidine kinase [Deltaproteobacteria bacterium]
MKRILTIAGSDSGGGAGIQADLKTITVLGGYGMSAITALTAQNTVGVQGIHPVPVDFIKMQIESVLSDYGADGAKTGMLATPDVVKAVAQQIKKFHIPLVVVDPVMVAKSGDVLLSKEARDTIKEELLPLAHLVTPNLPEASELCGFPVEDLEAMKKAAKKIHQLGPRHVLVKGGHLQGNAVDILFDGKDVLTFDSPRLNNRNTHGTGCTFSAALATFLAQGFTMLEATGKAKAFITRAIALGIDFGAGHGPTNHYAHVLRFKEREDVLSQLRKVVQTIVRMPVGALIPEIRSNLGFALPGALGPDEVAAVPGRISQVDEWPLVYRDPAFGASRHIAKVILAAMKFDPDIRSAMDIRYSEQLVELCRNLGFLVASFDRKDEPTEVKEMEGSTLEWGTQRAISDFGQIPDMIYDRGEVGKEPVIRILGKTPEKVAEKLKAIWKAQVS